MLFKGIRLRFQSMEELFLAFPIQFIGVLCDLFQITSNRLVCSHVAQLQIFNLPLVFLEGNDPIFDVSLADLGLDILVTDLIHHEHSSTTHRQADVSFLLLSLLQGRLFR